MRVFNMIGKYFLKSRQDNENATGGLRIQTITPLLRLFYNVGKLLLIYLR